MLPFFKQWKSKIQKDAFAAGIVEAQRQAQEDAQRQVYERRAQFEKIQMQSQIGTPLIRIPNEWANPTIGFGESIMDYGHSQVLVIRDYVSNELRVGGGICFDFSEQKMEALLRLDPFEAWALMAHNNVGHEHFDKKHTGHRNTAQEIRAMLEQNGFFERWKQFQIAHFNKLQEDSCHE